MFARYSTFQAGGCRIVDSPRPGVAQELVGSPDWVLEIASTSSMQKDKKLLRERYFAAGIGEYWLVDALGDEIDFQILLPAKSGYVPVEPADRWLHSPTFGCSFQLERDRDQEGFWMYTLRVRERS
jgi:Uma2 family endonuclease